MSNIYYVYAYLREDGSPYYIGKGKKRRAYHDHGRVRLPSNKSHIVFLEKNLTNIGALALERRYIKWYGRIDNGTGILMNLTDGGEGNPGLTFAPTLGKTPWNKGKKYPEELLVAMRKRRRESNMTPWWKGKTHSEETRAKLRKYAPWNKGKPGWKKGKKKGDSVNHPPL